MAERVPVAQAARELGLAVETVRYYMEIGELNIGTIIGKRKKRKTYLIYRELLNQETGRFNNGK